MPVAVAVVPEPTALQPSLFGAGAPTVLGGVPAERTELSHGAWVQHVPGFLAGDQALFDHLLATVSWHAHRRPMYDRVVAVPRLTATLPADGDGHPVLDEVVALLEEAHGSPFDRVGLALYRDGRDSVAPHGDQVARDLRTSTMATLSLGAPRRFLLSPVAGGPSRSLDLGHGDLLVMGGTIQRTWRHGVPKTNRPVGPRLCVMFRPPGLT